MMPKVKDKPDPKTGVTKWLNKIGLTDQADQTQIVNSFLHSQEGVLLPENNYQYISNCWSQFVKFVYSNTEEVE